MSRAKIKTKTSSRKSRASVIFIEVLESEKLRWEAAIKKYAQGMKPNRQDIARNIIFAWVRHVELNEKGKYQLQDERALFSRQHLVVGEEGDITSDALDPKHGLSSL
jgi:hypothetical protein